jgi:heme-degrading monooxygenase HmoA
VSVVFINCFEVPVGRETQFLDLWQQIDDYMCGKDGFQWRKLHRSLDDEARLRYVNVAGWDSAEQPGWQEFPALPALYAVERETAAATAGPDA